MKKANHITTFLIKTSAVMLALVMFTIASAHNGPIYVNTTSMSITFDNARLASDPHGYTGIYKTSSINIKTLYDNAKNTDGKISLPEAIIAANNTPGGHHIILENKVYELSTINNYWFGATALPPITNFISISGNGAVIKRAAGAPPMRLLSIVGQEQVKAWNKQASAASEKLISFGGLRIDAVHLKNGLAQGASGTSGGGGSAGLGGAIYNTGILNLLRSTLSHNKAQGGKGGDNTSSATAVAGNNATALADLSGYNAFFKSMLQSSSYGQANSAQVDGGGIASFYGLAGKSNTAYNGGGGGSALGGAIFNDSQLHESLLIVNSTIAQNQVLGGGGGNAKDASSQAGSAGSGAGAAIFINNGQNIKLESVTIHKNSCSKAAMGSGATAIKEASCGHGVYNYSHQRSHSGKDAAAIMLYNSIIANSSFGKNLASEFKPSANQATDSHSIWAVYSLIENKIESINGAKVLNMQNYGSEATDSASISNVFANPLIDDNMQLHGALTPNYKLQANSPALAKGMPIAIAGKLAKYDQRGVERELKTPKDATLKRFDIGSVEMGTPYRAEINLHNDYFQTDASSNKLVFSGSSAIKVSDDVPMLQTVSLSISGTPAHTIVLKNAGANNADISGNGNLSISGTLQQLNAKLKTVVFSAPVENQKTTYKLSYNDNRGEVVVKHFNITKDTTVPTVILTSSQTAVADSSTVSVNIKFSEEVTRLNPRAIHLEHAKYVSLKQTDDLNYQLIIKPTATGRTMQVRVNQNVVVDRAGLKNKQSNLLGINYTGSIKQQLSTQTEKKTKTVVQHSRAISGGAATGKFYTIILLLLYIWRRKYLRHSDS